jgi:hypothetical protein
VRWQTYVAKMLPNAYKKSLHLKSTNTVILDINIVEMSSGSSDKFSGEY